MRSGQDIAADAADLHQKFKNGWMSREDFRLRMIPIRQEMDTYWAVKEAERIVKWGL